MQVRTLFAFWLGATDTKVVVGSDSGGTHDLRFCSVASKIDEFTGFARDQEHAWRLPIEAYPAAGIAAWELRLVRYTGVVREGECAMPMQYADTPTAYPLWKRVVRELEPDGGRPLDAIILLRDVDDRFHARVLPWEALPGAPALLRGALGDRDECGKVLRLRMATRDIPDELFAT